MAIQGNLGVKTAVLAAGCFWNVQQYFDQLQGVIATKVGYTGGRTEKPTYDQVCSGSTGHAEAIRIDFDSNLIGYRQILQNFFKIHDPTTRNRQGPYVGENYRSAIFFLNNEQENIARQTIADLEAKKVYEQPIVTEVAKAGTFWEAEDYHQKYYEKLNKPQAAENNNSAN